ncbi:MAG: ribosome recycling factor [Chloroflexi bacterium]|nr:ribosome recycling factor [Chloroflexota bacterium]
MINDVLNRANEKMNASLENLKSEMAGIRTGRANTALVDGIKIDYAGVPTPLNHVASVSVQGATCIIIQPWDKNLMNAIDKAILRSDIGITPSNDGISIRLNIPPLNEERRNELIKMTSKRVEECKVAIRNVRRMGMDDLKKLEKESQISQDDLKRADEKLQKITDAAVAKASQIFEDKEKELREV